jgi:archaellum biogenesis protein FlaJ (TadC family)
MGTLEPYIKRLQSRLNSGLSPALCWERFRDETGSELINRTTRMLVDGVELGGTADQVGEIAGDYALSVGLLRAKRQSTATTFSYLSFPLHMAMTGLLVFILEVMKAFNLRIMEIGQELAEQLGGSGAFTMPDLPVFQPSDLSMVGYLILAVVIAMTIANSFAPHFATGGHPIRIVFYGSFMCVMSGVALLLIPPVASIVLQR